MHSSVTSPQSVDHRSLSYVSLFIDEPTRLSLMFLLKPYVLVYKTSLELSSFRIKAANSIYTDLSGLAQSVFFDFDYCKEDSPVYEFEISRGDFRHLKSILKSVYDSIDEVGKFAFYNESDFFGFQNWLLRFYSNLSEIVD